MGGEIHVVGEGLVDDAGGHVEGELQVEGHGDVDAAMI